MRKAPTILSSRCLASIAFGWCVAANLLVGCTRAELESKADAYNAAIAESNNRQILLNAVRASQRAPMSFVGYGDVAATPTFSGSAGGTFNFDPFGLTTYAVNPTVNVGGGFSNFQMNNLNSSEFVRKLQAHVPTGLVQYFDDLKFPKELIQLIFVQEYRLSAALYFKIQKDAAAKCAMRSEPRTAEFCEQFDRERAAFYAAGCGEFPITGPTATILNTGRNQCSMGKFQTFERQLRLLGIRLPFKNRTAQGMLYYLGELVAAQNYSSHPFVPEIFIATADGRRRAVPLFEVRRGTPAPGAAAVTVYHNGEGFYIPKPAFGAIDEARSLQVLDLVSQVIARVTAKGDLPRSSTITLISPR